jgi:methionyl-tRNA formyltransferase
MNILVLSKRDLTSTVMLNDLAARLHALPTCRLSIVLAERTRPVELVVPELVRMKRLERDLPFGFIFPRLDAEAEDSGDGLLRTPAQLAAHYGISVTVARRMDDPVITDALSTFPPDLIISARFSFLIPAPFFEVPRYGIINVHPGRLPDYAGLYPHFFSMLAGEAELGSSVHVMDEGIDSGPLLAEGAVPILPGRSAFMHNLECHLLGNRLVAELVGKLLSGQPMNAVPQRRSNIKSNTYPTPSEFEMFRSAGFSLIEPDEYQDILRRFGAGEDCLGVAEGAMAH